MGAEQAGGIELAMGHERVGGMMTQHPIPRVRAMLEKSHMFRRAASHSPARTVLGFSSTPF